MGKNDKDKVEEFNLEEFDGGVITLTDVETGEDKEFELYARCTIDGQEYCALVPQNQDEVEYIIFKILRYKDGPYFENIDDDEEYEKVEDYFNDLLFGEVDYDEN